MSPRIGVGEMRSSQVLFTFGVGSIIDLPNLSVIAMGLDDWDLTQAPTITEERLLAAVRRRLGGQVQRLYAPPRLTDTGLGPAATQDEEPVGVPVVPFPRWLVCPRCRLLAPLSQGSFELRIDRYHPDRSGFIHTYCGQAGARRPPGFPARFLMACDAGHLDDFPWLFFVHKGSTVCPGPLKFYELGPSGEARDVEVACQRCQAKRRMADAFGDDGMANLPTCRGRRVHLRDEEPDGCPEQPRTMLIGASNLWFAASLSVLSIPVSGDRLAQAVADLWSDFLERATTKEIVAAFLGTPPFRKLAGFSVDEVWAAVLRRRNPPAAEATTIVDLKGPEWALFSNPGLAPSSSDFRLREIKPPSGFESRMTRVVLAERLREVQALTGFTRIESPGDLMEAEGTVGRHLVPLSRRVPTWVPATEARGEGLFIQFREDEVQRWLKGRAAAAVAGEFRVAHGEWRRRRHIEPPDAAFPGLRYVLLHSFAHALVRQLALECGYTTASLRERLYCRDSGQEGGPMAGVLLYTAAPDSEGTLGGLVSLGQPEELDRLIGAALEQGSLCTSDPLCSEARPTPDGRILHGAACHSCLLSPETFCERGNRYLDRSTLVGTVAGPAVAFFS